MDKKQKNVHTGLYIMLAFMVTAIVAVSIFTAVSKRKEPPSVLPNTDTTTPTTTIDRHLPQGTETTDSDKTTAAPDDVTTAEKDAGAEPAEPVGPTKPVYQMPVLGYVSKDYSDSVLIYSLTMDDYRTHMGIDICASVGTVVMAFADGTVSRVYDDPMCGMTVVISHADGLESYYMNLQSTLPAGIEVGKSVKAGDTIGGIGETMITEIADASHLHFELKRGTEYVDPMDYLTSYTGDIDYTE